MLQRPKLAEARVVDQYVEPSVMGNQVPDRDTDISLNRYIGGKYERPAP